MNCKLHFLVIKSKPRQSRQYYSLHFDISGNSISNDLVFDWTQKNEIVVVSVLVGPGHDNRTVNIHTEPTRLSVSLLDGRKFSTKLYETIVPEGTSISFKGPRCIIKLLKNDPNIEWLQLEVRMIIQELLFCVSHLVFLHYFTSAIECSAWT